jgi:hypothetical protein
VKSGQLTWTSRPTDGWGFDATGRRPPRLDAEGMAALARALTNRQLGAVVWNHAFVANEIPYPRRRGVLMSVGLGDAGIHRFRGLEVWARLHPAGFLAAVRPAAEDAWREAASMAAMRTLRHVIGAPSFFVPCAWLVLRPLVLDSVCRRWILACLRNPDLRSDRGWTGILQELMRLEIARHAGRESGRRHASFHVETEIMPEQQMVILRSCVQPVAPLAGSVPRQGSPPHRILWDHSAIKEPELFRIFAPWRLGVRLEPSSTFEFQALSRYARERPDEVWKLLPPPSVGAIDRVPAGN